MNPSLQKNIPAIQVLIAGVLFGTAGTIVTYAPETASSGGLGIMRLFVGAIFLLLFLPRFNASIKDVVSLAKRPLVWVMAATSASYQPLFFGATERNGVAISTLLTVGCIPIFAGLIGRIFLKEKLNSAWFIATSLAIIGLALRSIGEIEISDLTGVLMAIGAGAAVGCYLNAAKLELRKGANQIALPATAYLIGCLFLLPLLKGQSMSWVLEGSGFFIALYLGIVTMAIANAFQIAGLRQVSPGPAATLTLADPFTATLLGVIVLGEEISAVGVLGIMFVAIALIWQSKSLAEG